MQPAYLTRDGYEKLTHELEFLRGSKRREISSAIEQARLLGDLRENAEYHAAKEAMANNEKRVAELEDILGRVEIIEDTKIDPTKAYLGARVTLKDLATGEEIVYTLVGPAEANPLEGFISASSPVGRALLGHAIGDEISISVPAGELKYKIINISR